MAEVERMLDDDRSLYAEALKELEEGRMRKAAENAWCAILRAIDALILVKTGEKPVRSDLTTDRLHYLEETPRLKTSSEDATPGPTTCTVDAST